MTKVILSRSVHITAPAEVVFAAMTDWPGQSEWMVGTSVKALKNDGKGVDATIVARTSLGPFGFNDQMTITEWQPPFRCGVLHTGRVVRGSGLFSVEPTDGVTSLFVWSEEIKVPFGIIGLMGWQVFQWPVGLGLSWSLGRFKRWAQAGGSNPPSHAG